MDGGEWVVPASIDELIAALPKVELHVHLEGSLQPALLLELAYKHGVVGLPASLEAVREWYEFRDFPRFIDARRRGTALRSGLAAAALVTTAAVSVVLAVSAGGTPVGAGRHADPQDEHRRWRDAGLA
jgi:adenosine deaminase